MTSRRVLKNHALSPPWINAERHFGKTSLFFSFPLFLRHRDEDGEKWRSVKLRSRHVASGNIYLVARAPRLDSRRPLINELRSSQSRSVVRFTTQGKDWIPINSGPLATRDEGRNCIPLAKLQISSAILVESHRGSGELMLRFYYLLQHRPRHCAVLAPGDGIFFFPLASETMQAVGKTMVIAGGYRSHALVKLARLARGTILYFSRRRWYVARL